MTTKTNPVVTKITFSEKQQQFMEAFASLSDDPFEMQKGQVYGAHPKRTTEKGRKRLERKRKERNRYHHPDKDIDLEIQQYGEENVKVHYDSNP